MPVWLTVVAGAALSAAPTFLSFLPPPISAALTGLIALGTGAYHLYQPAPSTPAAQ
jgi:hypothetical protein